MGDSMWITAGGSRYHRSTSCPGLRDGYAKAAELGLPNHPVQRTTEEAALEAGRTPCSRCVLDALPSITPEWGSFLSQHGAVLRETPFEREFVIRVLAQVGGLKPSEVRPQETVVDQDGRSRRIDFAVHRPGLKLAWEVDGAEKVARDPGLSGDRLDDALRRQNALVAAGWRVLRFSNAQVMSESARCARTIAEQLAVPVVAAASDQPSALKPVPAPPPPTPDASTSKAGWWIAAAVVVGLVGAAAVVAASGGGGEEPPPPVEQRGDEPLSEAQQRRLDLQKGAVAPATKDDCPESHQVKANYRPDRGTRYYFVQADGRFYEATDPTSCWKDAESARAGGYIKR